MRVYNHSFALQANMSINTGTHLQEAASRRMVRAGYFLRWASLSRTAWT